MIEVNDLSKRYGEKLAVDSLSFAVRPGVVTGFLGPNGAGMSTTMRVIMGLDRPTSGQVRVNGRSYARLKAPLQDKLGARDRVQLVVAAYQTGFARSPCS
ncbi:ATP-binding cassette domain-containing protein [Micromonospora sp. KC207]|uniref:ATP-binding cassette domain-containing protein n=1 Tax=Micromonospora sp. KC207 TaxID=2530377 RepID=UPI0026AC5D21